MEQKTKRNIFSLVSDIDVEESMRFFNVELKLPFLEKHGLMSSFYQITPAR